MDSGDTDARPMTSSGGRPMTANLGLDRPMTANVGRAAGDHVETIPEDDDEGMFSFLPPLPTSTFATPMQTSVGTPATRQNNYGSSWSQQPTTANIPDTANTAITQSSVLLSPAAAYASMMSRRRGSKISQDGNEEDQLTSPIVGEPFGSIPPTAASDGYVVSRSPRQHQIIELEARMAKAANLRRTDSKSSSEVDQDKLATLPQLHQRDGLKYGTDYDIDASVPTTRYNTQQSYIDKLRDIEIYDGRSPEDLLAELYEEEEDSPFPEVRAAVSNIDDPEMPCLTIRSWFIGITLNAFFSAVNLFFSLRYPSPYLTPILMQILAYPCGKFLAAVLPTTSYTTPKFLQKWFGCESEWSLNPGPFNIKEHTIIIIMANAAIAPAFALNLTLVLDKYYHTPKGVGFDIMLILSTQMVGFSFAGMCRRFLVWPAGLVWPSNLVNCTLLNTFHAEDDDGRDGSLTRYKFFLIVTIGSGVWYLFPDFLFIAVSVFSYICWMAPNNLVINQLFGVSTGLGMGVLTFDWGQISFIGSPLITPWWAIANTFAGFVLVYWILTPIFYYTNTWDLAYMPIWSTDVFDRFGEVYDISRVLDAQQRFNVTAYENYSPLYLPATYVSVYTLALLLSSGVIVHTALYHGPSIWNKLKKVRTEPEDVHMKLMRNYPEVPDWWYYGYFAVFFGVSVVAVEVWDTGVPVWGLVVALAIAAIYTLPGGFIYAMTSQQISTNLLAELIPGYILPGNPIALMTFKSFAVQSILSAFNFTQDLKLGHYMKIPPRITFCMQILCTATACFAQIGTKYLLLASVPDLCQPDQANKLVCPGVGVFFSASIIWGGIGPRLLFGVDSNYRLILWALLFGAFLPVPFWFMSRKWPKSWLRYVNIPVLVTGASYIPPGTGINYSSWFVVGFIFQYWMRRYRFRWWSKFTFVLSASLEGGTVIGGILIFLCLQLPKGGLEVNWWGNDVFTRTLDWEDPSYLTPPVNGFGRTTWIA